MKCNECLEMMDQAIELELTADQSEAFREHLAACPDCRKQYEALQSILESLGDMPMKPLPENFQEELHEKLVQIKAQEKSTKKPIGVNWVSRHRKQLSVAAAVVLVLTLSTTMLPSLFSGSDKSYEMASQDMAYGDESTESFGAPSAMPPDEPAFDGNVADAAAESKNGDMLMAESMPLDRGVEPSVTVPTMVAPVEPTDPNDSLQGRKVIQTGNMELEVSHYDEAAAAIKAMVVGSGGYIQDLSEYYYYGRDGETQLKAGYMTVRVPAIQFDSSFDFIKGLGKAVSQSANAQDITQQYRDVYSEKLNLEVREEQLRGIMAKAVRIEDIIMVEGELSRVRGQINALAGNLQQWDGLISLATITINMREVEDFSTKIEPIKKDIWTKASEAFTESMNELTRGFENLLITLVANIPQLIISLVSLLILFFVGRVIFKKIQKWSDKK